MTSIERSVKAQYERVIECSDWVAFLRVAEYYLATAAKLKTSDIETEFESNQLLIRNIQKRLFIGIGCELLLKAFYLKNGYGINKPKRGNWRLYKLNEVNADGLKPDDTYSMNFLLDHLKNGPHLRELSTVERGFRIAKVFRNKEGHIAAFTHKFDPVNYSDIESALELFYREAFSEKLEIQFSMEPNEPGKFEVIATPA
jgi:hypothetical protein